MIDPKTHELDPVYVHSLHEAKVILAVFAIFAIYVLSMAFSLGVHPTAEPEGDVMTVVGVPSWVFWSIVVPWLAANVVTGWFCFVLMRKDALEDKQSISGEATNEPNPPGFGQASKETDVTGLNRRGQNDHE